MATAKVLALKVPLFYIPGWQSEVDKSHEKYKIHSVILNIYTKNHVQECPTKPMTLIKQD